MANKYVKGFDPVNRSVDSDNAAMVIVKGNLSNKEAVVTYRYRDTSKRNLKKEVRMAAKYYGAAIDKSNKK